MKLVATANANSIKNRILSVLRDAIALTKPRVISLLLFTTFAAMFITPAGMPTWNLVAWTMLGGYLMSGGANAVNMAYDSDIDMVMGRTSKRPVPSGRVKPITAYVYGFALMTASILIFGFMVNWLAAACALAGFIYYTVIYTAWLKRRTTQNIVIGGGAGAIPPLVGWAAAAGSLNLTAVMLFVIIFVWTPPHFWALALMKQRDYATAKVPMLPVVVGAKATAQQIWLYSWVMLLLTLVLVPMQAMGWLYLMVALISGGWFLLRAWQLLKDTSFQRALVLYKYSLLYLALLFLGMLADRVILQ